MKRSFIFITLIILIALETPAPAQQRNPADSARRARAITGRVVNESGQPIPNAAIHLGLVGSNRFLGRPLVTDEEGRFSADELVTGSYYMHVNVPGYVQADNPTPHTYYRVGDSITIRMTKGGVITGSVTNSAGEPVVAVSVRAVFVRDLEGGPGRGFTFFNDMPTDDRGVYRLYGLRPGVYHVLATGQDLGFITGSSPYDNDAPTYYPASTRDTAAEVIVRAGDEASGIDIRYRGERGHAISGTVTSSIKVDASSPSGININLLHAQTGALEATAFISNGQKNNRFAFYGVPDGKYELTATHITNAENFSASPTRRVTVKGSDVTGVELALTPLGSIAGRVVLEPLQKAERKAECEQKRPSSLQEVVVAVRRDGGEEEGIWPSLFGGTIPGAPGETGEFKIYALKAGRFHLESQLPGDGLYVRAMALPGPAPAKQNSAVQNGFSIRQGEQLSGLTINVAEGAASIRGKVTPSAEGGSLPPRLRVHLAPADREQAENVLRYGEAVAQADGSFTLTNIAPGRYWLVARAPGDAESNETTPRPASWDAASRAALRREGEAAGAALELSLCQRVADHALRYAPVAQKPPAKKTE